MRKIKSVTMISIVLNAIRIQITEKQIRIAYYLQITRLMIHSKKCKISKLLINNKFSKRMQKV
jgi:hypothetical protein